MHHYSKAWGHVFNTNICVNYGFHRKTKPQKNKSSVQLFNICEGSCDTEDCSNDAENSALHRRNKLHFKIYSNKKKIFEIIKTFHNITVLLYTNQINAALVSIRDVFQRRNTYWACLTCSHTCKMPCFLEILMAKLKSELKFWQYVQFSLILCCQTSIFFFCKYSRMNIAQS